MSGGKCIQIIKGLFLFKILFSKGFFHKMRENPKAILLPRSSHPVRDSYLLIARPEGCWPLELGVVKHGAHGSISKFVNAYLSTQVHLEGKIWQESATFHAIKEHHIQNVICSAMIVILALKNQLFDNTGKVWRPIFQQSEVWNCEKIISVKQLYVFYSDELKNAYYANTNKFFLYLKSKKMIFLDFWQNRMKL